MAIECIVTPGQKFILKLPEGVEYDHARSLEAAVCEEPVGHDPRRISRSIGSLSNTHVSALMHVGNLANVCLSTIHLESTYSTLHTRLVAVTQGFDVHANESVRIGAPVEELLRNRPRLSELFLNVPLKRRGI